MLWRKEALEQSFGLAAGHAATRKMTAEQAVEMLQALGVSAFTDPVALVKAAAKAIG